MAEAKKESKTKKTTKKAEVVAETVPVEAEVEKKLEIEQPEAVEASQNTTDSLAKSGKRSAKSQKAAEEKQAKEERKVSGPQKAVAKKTARPPRTKLERAGKKIREAAGAIDSTKSYTLKEAADLATKTSPTKFDATVELHINLGVDPKQADQNVRDTVMLPAGTGKSVRIAVIAEADDATKAKKAGADIVGTDEILAALDEESIDFDILIATPQMMPKLGKYARLLGPRGLMPNPKSGTVAADVAKAVSEAKAGKVEYRVDASGIVHMPVGKVSFGAEKLEQNAAAALSSVRSARPASLKGIYIKSAYVTTTMGPSIKLEV